MPNNYPALFAGLAQTILAFFLANGSLTAGQAGVIEAAVAAVAALAVAISVHQFTTAVLTGAVNAVITLLVAFQVPHATPGLVSLVDALIVAVAAFFVHTNASPKRDTRKAVAG